MNIKAIQRRDFIDTFRKPQDPKTVGKFIKELNRIQKLNNANKRL